MPHLDCLLIGGGVIGLSIAYELSRRGAQVRVLERGRPGREASWAGAGILPPAPKQHADHPYDRLRTLSMQLHPGWARQLQEETGIDTGFEVCGGLYVARRAGEAASLIGTAELFREQGIRAEKLSGAEAAEIEPALRSAAAQIRTAVALPEEAQLRNPRHLQALHAACLRRGVEVVSESEVQHLRIVEGRAAAAVTASEEHTADRFCVTGGAWSYRLLDSLGIATGILPVRGQMVMFRCPQRPLQRVLSEGSRYIVPRADGRVLVGSTEEEVGFDKQTTEQGVNDLIAFGRGLVGPLEGAEVEQVWAGLRPGSFDGFPYLGRAAEPANLFVAAGHFRSGLYLSPGTAVVLADLLLDRPSTIELSPFSLLRG